MLALGCIPFPSRLGTTQVSRGLAPLGIDQINIRLDFETTPGPFGGGLFTLTPGWAGRKRLIVRATGKYSFGDTVYLFY